MPVLTCGGIKQKRTEKMFMQNYIQYLMKSDKPMDGSKRSQNGPDHRKGGKMGEIRPKIAKVPEIFIFQAEFVLTVLHFWLYTQVKT